jgi:uncharacterized coiled-coil DUF342 family protein
MLTLNQIERKNELKQELEGLNKKKNSLMFMVEEVVDEIEGKQEEYNQLLNEDNATVAKHTDEDINNMVDTLKERREEILD